MKKKLPAVMLLVLALSGILTSMTKAQEKNAAASPNVQTDEQDVTLTIGNFTTRVEIWNENVVRVMHRPANGVKPPESLTVIAKPAKVDCMITDEASETVLATPKMQVHVDKATGRVDNDSCLIQRKPSTAWASIRITR